MSGVKVRTNVGHTMIEMMAIECPFCHSKVNPEYLYVDNSYLFALCSNSNCGKYMILIKENGFYTKIQQNSEPLKKTFSSIISDISPDFVIIYNQAFYAEQIHLDQICGVGYRKALEFLINDYLIHNSEDEVFNGMIRNKFLNNCIQDDVKNEIIKEVARRAVWLGNDETHYIRKWADKDISNLKGLIDLTIRWIENEVETKAILASMPEPNK